MKNALHTILLMLITVSLSAQFKPGDIGYFPAMMEPYARMHVTTQVETKTDPSGWSTPYTQSTFNESGWLTEVLYLQDSSLSEEERSPDMVDAFYYHADGRIRMIEMTGYDILPIQYGFEYDKKNRLTASVIASAEAREYTYVLNKKEQVTQRFGKGARWVYADEQDTEGKLQMVPLDVTDYNWNADGLLASEDYSYMGEWQHRIVYGYTPSGQLQSLQMYYDQGETAVPVFTTTYVYDANGLLQTATTQEGADAFVSTFTYAFK